MNVYYQNWVEVVASLDRLQLYLFLIVLTGYWINRWYGRGRFVWVSTGFSLTIVGALIEPLFR